MRIYIAGASAEWDRAQSRMDWARENGFTIAYDWVADVIKYRVEGGQSDADLTKEDRRRLATNDMAAVIGCDAFWLLVPNEGALTVGAWVELGVALGAYRPVIVSGACIGDHLFCSLADHQYDVDTDAMQWLLDARVRRASPDSRGPG